MAKKISIDETYLQDILVQLLNIPSPTGYTDAAIQFTQSKLEELGLTCRQTPKGTLVAEWPGKTNDKPRGLTAHIDTLGAMVSEIKQNGRLKLSQLGGYAWNSIEGEGCLILTRSGRSIRGSVLLTKASGHIHGEKVATTPRDGDTIEVRIDERSLTMGETEDLGISVGDFVAFDPRVESSPSGFIRSRHLDDKAGIACLLAAAQAMIGADKKPSQRTILHISNYEEVGHGAAAGFPSDLFELVAIDMAPVGEGQTSDEFTVTICAKDKGGPYHHKLTRRLEELAQSAEIPYKTDVYPFYGSDGEAYWRAGGDVRVALLGPGIDASHSYERTHIDSLRATTQLIIAYIQSS
jgi:putative aminopeptidase FrvX